MNNSFQKNINFLITAAFITGCCFLFACKQNDPRQIDAWTRKKVMVEKGDNITSYLSQEGKMKAKLRAPVMYRYEGKDTITIEFPNSLHVDFYNDSTKIESWVDSKKGKYFENLNKVYLWDSVVVINVSGDTLKASDMWWDQNTKLFYTEKYAEYLRKDGQIYPSNGLEVTQDFHRKTFKNVTGKVQVKENGFPD